MAAMMPRCSRPRAAFGRLFGTFAAEQGATQGLRPGRACTVQGQPFLAVRVDLLRASVTWTWIT